MASVLCQAWSLGLGTRRSDCTPHGRDPVGGLCCASLVTPASVSHPLLPLDVLCVWKWSCPSAGHLKARCLQVATVPFICVASSRLGLHQAGGTAGIAVCPPGRLAQSCDLG